MKKTMTLEERNISLKSRGIADYSKVFTISFRDRKKVFFVIEYGSIVNPNQDPYFSTSALIMNHIRSDWNGGGQAQKRLLKNKHLVRFFNKWDVKHLHPLSVDEYKELIRDIEELKVNVSHIETDNFYELVKFDRELSNRKKPTK